MLGNTNFGEPLEAAREAFPRVLRVGSRAEEALPLSVPGWTFMPSGLGGGGACRCPWAPTVPLTMFPLWTVIVGIPLSPTLLWLLEDGSLGLGRAQMLVNAW